MKENPNHRNYFLKKAKTEEVVEVPKEVVKVPVEEVVEEPVEEVVPEKAEPVYTEEGLYELKKREQVAILKDLGLDKAEIKELKYEKERVDKILEICECE